MPTERFTAPTISEAIQKIKSKYGKDALIISTRKVKKNSGMFGIFGSEMFEVLAAPDSSSFNNQTKHDNSSATIGDLPIDQSLAEPKDYVNNNYAYSNFTSKPIIAPANNYQNSVLSDQMYEVRDMITNLSNKFEGDDNTGQQFQYMRREINELKGIIKSIANQKKTFFDKDWHENLLSIFQQLTINGLEEKFALRVIEEIKKKVSSANFEDYEYLKLFCARLFMKATKTLDIMNAGLTGQKVITFLGVTGVGKTTMIAKIAATIKLKDPNQKVGLITLDNFRIKAADQLKEYAKIIKSPFKAASDVEDVAYAIKSMRDCNWILIDTPGASQRDSDRINITGKGLSQISNLKNILVLSATTRDQELAEISRKFRTKDTLGTIFTKLDEASTYGVILNHMIRFKLPALFFGSGQKVPDDIELASHERLLDLVLNMAEVMD